MDFVSREHAIIRVIFLRIEGMNYIQSGCSITLKHANDVDDDVRDCVTTDSQYSASVTMTVAVYLRRTNAFAKRPMTVLPFTL